MDVFIRRNKNMKLWYLFTGLCIACLLIYGTVFAIGSTNPQLMLGMSMFMILSGWGAGAFFILAIVMFVLKK